MSYLWKLSGSKQSFLGLFALLGLLSFTSGCPDKKPKFPSCEKDKDCKDGQFCFQKTCSECAEDSHCEDFERCDMGSCVLKDGMCRTKADCTAGQICKDHTCTACEDDNQCGPEGKCSNGACMERGACKVDEDCADDEDCIAGLCQRAGRNSPPELSCTMDSVFFGFDEYSIPDTSKESLQSTSECIQQGEDRQVYIEGHTDDQGTDEYNIALSEKRGRSVADFLARLGIDPSRLRVIPKGESESTASSDSDRSEERRVDFEWQ